MMRGLLLDTNILTLLVVGTWNIGAISESKRTSIYSPGDYKLLLKKIAEFPRILTTSSVLTELSNLMGNQFHNEIAETIVARCMDMVEVVNPKEVVFQTRGFNWLGYADASILAALDETTQLLTDDLALYSQALYQGNEAVNFNHLRRFN